MTVKELKEIIANIPDEMEVVLQKDSEGNGYSPLAGADPDAVYIAETTWCGDVYSMDWTADDACMSDEEWEKNKVKTTNIDIVPCELMVYNVTQIGLVFRRVDND